MTVLFDGIALGMLLFLISVGLSVTLGLMNFVNLAHGAFAMVGGYTGVVLVNNYKMAFPWALLCLTGVCFVLGIAFERTLYRRLYAASHMDHVLFTVGLLFISISVAAYFFGSNVQSIKLPPALVGDVHVFGFDFDVYRLFLIILAAVIAGALQLVLSRTRFGAQLRAAVDNPRTARGLGIEVDIIFTFAFALGCALAGMGGALGTELLGLDPMFAIKYVVYFLIVVIVGGPGSIIGSLAASLFIGVADVLGKYYVPDFGAFVIYVVMLAMLVARSRGLLPNFGGRA